MPMATTREVGLCPAALTVDTQVSCSDSGLCSRPGVEERVQMSRLPALQHALPALGKSSPPAGMPTLRGLSCFALGISL